MMVSFLEGRSGLLAPTDFRNLLGAECPRRKLFERAEGNAVSLAQGTIDGTRFGHAHLGLVENQSRDIARMSVAVADEASASKRLEDCRLKHPEVLFGAAECQNGFGLNTPTPLMKCNFQQIRMTDILGVLVPGCGGKPFIHGEPLWRDYLHRVALPVDAWD
jgi:hypothetical protein